MSTYNKLFLIGCGGTGGRLAPPLLQLLTYHEAFDAKPNCFTLIDGDSFEPHNRSRQVMAEDDLGRNKAQALSAALARAGQSNVVSVDDYVSKRNLVNLTANSRPIVVAAVDNDGTRLITLEHLREFHDDFIWLSPGNNDANDEGGMRGQVVYHWRSDGRDNNIAPTEVYANLRDGDRALVPRKGGCSEHAPSTPQLLSANMLAAAFTCSVLQLLLDGHELDFNQTAQFFDGKRGMAAIR